MVGRVDRVVGEGVLYYFWKRDGRHGVGNGYGIAVSRFTS